MGFNNSKLGIYIHIPFCNSKCNYCSFFSFKAEACQRDEYIKNILNSIDYWHKELKDKIVDTIYIGGGTPTVLNSEQIISILDKIHHSFNVDKNCEVTIEANPVSACNHQWKDLREAGINRVSLGMQSAVDDELALLGRKHQKEDVINATGIIKDAGIKNISLDIMLGIPKQTTDTIRESIDFALKLNAQHISTYLLSVEPNTYFSNNKEKFNFADDDLQAEFYSFTCDYLKSYGFEHYEISNFCKDGLYSRHNSRYWKLENYLGIGPSAHSMIDGKRFYYTSDIHQNFTNNFILDGIGQTKEEYIMLMLRTNMGIDKLEFAKLFDNSLCNDFISSCQKYIEAGYMEIDDNRIRLTEKGFLVSNTIIADLI